jgi:REP element-mobilizing transposase RayT
VHKHLRRLERVWIDQPIYFITTCTSARRAILATDEFATILIDEWRGAHDRHRWEIGRYVIMPDHVHLFCRAELDAKSLPIFMQKWKQWSSKRMARGLKLAGGIWQEEFFDHVLRSSESYSQKWNYVKENPVRAGLVKRFDDWLFQGENRVANTVAGIDDAGLRARGLCTPRRDHRSRLHANAKGVALRNKPDVIASG